MSRENVQDKGRRMLREGRLTVIRVMDPVDGARAPIRATCRGDSGRVYGLGFDMDDFEWRCTCPARGLCSHLVALQLVVLEPKPIGGEFP